MATKKSKKTKKSQKKDPKVLDMKKAKRAKKKKAKAKEEAPSPAPDMRRSVNLTDWLLGEYRGNAVAARMLMQSSAESQQVIQQGRQFGLPRDCHGGCL